MRAGPGAPAASARTPGGRVLNEERDLDAVGQAERATEGLSLEGCRP